MKLYDDKKFIGEIIKSARKNANLNQAQLAEKLSMTEKNISNIENGKQFPQVNNFLRILEVLNLSIEDFGVKNISEIQKAKNELLQNIYLATPAELEVYTEILQSVKKLNKK